LAKPRAPTAGRASGFAAVLVGAEQTDILVEQTGILIEPGDTFRQSTKAISSPRLFIYSNGAYQARNRDARANYGRNVGHFVPPLVQLDRYDRPLFGTDSVRKVAGPPSNTVVWRRYGVPN
jgi:hypothetical protein